MISGKHYFLFRLDSIEDDPEPEYRVAESYDDLQLRFGDMFLRKFYCVTQLEEVTIEHIIAIHRFLLQQL